MNTIPIPPLLSEIPDPPKKLYIRGTLPKNFNQSLIIAIVGSRSHTEYGKKVCETIIQGLQSYPVIIVSGLAIGIDSIAHESALKYGIPTIAIPGSGLHNSVLYPRRNIHLAQNIIDEGGCLLSEYEPTFHATSWSFPRRNRIMAGLAHIVLVIESEIVSGTRITAKLAVEYNREVGAVPGSILSSKSEGANQLINDGAAVVRTSEDIIELFSSRKEFSFFKKREQ